MTKHEKIIFVILLGSLLGAVELFGGDIMRAAGLSHKSALQYGLAVMIMIASKRILDFNGSVIIMSAIAALFKTISDNFYTCQMAAVMINGVIFEGGYYLLKAKFDTNRVWRIVAAPVITYISFAVFALIATYFLREPNWAERGLSGIVGYLATSAFIASIVSIIMLNTGYYLGNWAKNILALKKPGYVLLNIRTVAVAVVIIIWIAGLKY